MVLVPTIRYVPSVTMKSRKEKTSDQLPSKISNGGGDHRSKRESKASSVMMLKVHHASPLHRQIWFLSSTLVLVVAALLTMNSLLTPFLHRIKYSFNPQQLEKSNRNVRNNTKSTGSTTMMMADNTDELTDSMTMAAEKESLSPVTFPFRYRGPKLNDTVKAMLTKKWGKWSILQDSKAPRRPALPCHEFDHCDVPRAKFPDNAWQTDPAFLTKFLKQGQALITRAQEAILAEYGQSKFDKPNKTLAERSFNFRVSVLTLNDTVHPPNSKRQAIDNGGWTTQRSFQGLVRRLLHAIMTQDTFTFALGGHSVAAGHGNYFKQSYSMQFHKAMEPIFGRLGVNLTTYNFGKGGLGTAQDSMGMATLWGSEIDMCMWDSGMTEFSSSHYDLFARQALIGGNRVPILWNGVPDVMEVLHNEADVDIGGPGTGLKGTPYSQSKQQAEQLPYAVRFLRCTHSRSDLCDNKRYNAVCWIYRPDVHPPRKQSWDAGGRMLQHPGFRSHQLLGRVLAFTVLLGLEEALKQWKNAPNYELPDEAWHVTPYYQNIRTKLAKLTSTPCFNDTNMPSPRICTTPMKGVSEYTPRAQPEKSSIRSIMVDTTYIGKPPRNVYRGPDVYNPYLEPPADAVNYLAIVENDDMPSSPPPPSLSGRQPALGTYNVSSKATKPNRHRRLDVISDAGDSGGGNSGTSGSTQQQQLPIGRGWALRVVRDDLYCNGTYDSECSRFESNTCLLYGHNDGKGGLLFDSLSGWLLLRLKDVKEGLIIIKMETWQHRNHRGKDYPVESNPMTEGWTEENNGMTTTIQQQQQQGRRRRRLSTLFDATKSTLDNSTVAPELCQDFSFEYAINGHIQTMNKEEFLNKRVFVQRLVETWTLLDDPNFTTTHQPDGGDDQTKKTMDVELGIRMQGCQRLNVFKLTHVYWA